MKAVRKGKLLRGVRAPSLGFESFYFNAVLKQGVKVEEARDQTYAPDGEVAVLVSGWLMGHPLLVKEEDVAWDE